MLGDRFLPVGTDSVASGIILAFQRGNQSSKRLAIQPELTKPSWGFKGQSLKSKTRALNQDLHCLPILCVWEVGVCVRSCSM